MENLLFFDTETTGLPLIYDEPGTEVDNWPRMVQLSWIVSTVEREIVKRQSFIIRPEGFTIPEEATAIHGITNELATNYGTDLKVVLEAFIVDLKQAGVLVGHNILFDKNVVIAEMCRMGGFDYELFYQKVRWCTMRQGSKFCKIPNEDEEEEGYKWPKLQELHRALFKTEFEDKHDAATSVMATFRCFWKLLDLKYFDGCWLRRAVYTDKELADYITECNRKGDDLREKNDREGAIAMYKRSAEVKSGYGYYQLGMLAKKKMEAYLYLREAMWLDYHEAYVPFNSIYAEIERRRDLVDNLLMALFSVITASFIVFLIMIYTWP